MDEWQTRCVREAADRITNINTTPLPARTHYLNVHIKHMGGFDSPISGLTWRAGAGRQHNRAGVLLVLTGVKTGQSPARSPRASLPPHHRC